MQKIKWFNQYFLSSAVDALEKYKNNSHFLKQRIQLQFEECTIAAVCFTIIRVEVEAQKASFLLEI